MILFYTIKVIILYIFINYLLIEVHTKYNKSYEYGIQITYFNLKLNHTTLLYNMYLLHIILQLLLLKSIFSSKNTDPHSETVQRKGIIFYYFVHINSHVAKYAV